jgi:NAD(P)-dependent dehydrogenase (short-subunit alcohol dehydrogenase family)
LRLAGRGASVAVNYVRDDGAAEQTVEAVQQFGGKGFIIRADVSRPDRQPHQTIKVLSLAPINIG